ncbi:methyltransferase RsmF C-terminal domain-like protein [Parapedobacter lycopersici]|uniref:methyltransferase RsmF C-terminal domain-like protein n=1 Tax=Parapedobacter lycopersici TaxID=1864939 RepID=UPI00214D4B86|nr:RNA methyltransferase [Parapedobacter lycopersici]
MSHIIPPPLVRKLGNQAGFDTAAFEQVHAQGVAPVSIRINPAKPEGPDTGALERVPWCDTGYYLPERPVFTLDPLFHAGCYYVQEASSMFVAHTVQALALHAQPVIAVDLCAAPGGKSTLLRTYLHPDSLLIANEPIKTRAHVLADNLVRWGHTNTVVTQNDPSAFGRLPGYADLLLVDAPCSGSGMFRKDQAVVDEWSEAVVQLCSERQRRILADSLPALKTGGVLLYSTCSYSAEENEEIADWLCEEQGMAPVAIPLVDEWGIEQTYSAKWNCPGYRFYPHRVRGEGFFLAAFRKVAETPVADRRRTKAAEAPNLNVLKKWLVLPARFTTFNLGDDLFVFPVERREDLEMVQRMLYIRHAGTCVGKLVKGEVIPHHDLAMNIALHPDIPRISLDRTQALDYLRKGNLSTAINPQGHTGWAIADYNGASLGWMKLMPNRVNNYYPKTWRIATL